MTKYTVLIQRIPQSGGPVSYDIFLGEYEAANDEAAIKAALASGNGDGDPSGTYVAVPSRSFRPRKVEAKQAYSFS